MSEIIDENSNEFSWFFVISAITRAEVVDKVKPLPIEITLLANGVELPFVDTMEDIYERMQKELNERATKIAEKMVTEARLDGISDALCEVEWKIKDALAKVDLR